MVILVDTSVWIDYLRRSGSRADTELTRMIEDDEELRRTEPVVMELLAGPTDEFTARRIASTIDALDPLHVDPLVDFREAAAIFRAVRRSGRTVRSKVDCLIAAIAIRHGATLLHKDADFDVIAAVTRLDSRSVA
jgi:predicted nucleic acid-binding protein